MPRPTAPGAAGARQAYLRAVTTSCDQYLVALPLVTALMFFAAGLAGMLFSANVGAEYATAGASIPAFALAGEGGDPGCRSPAGWGGVWRVAKRLTRSGVAGHSD